MVLSLLWATWFPGALSARSDDWPAWRYDAGRTAASPAELPAELRLQWTRELPESCPAFPNDPRLCFDGCYEPIAAGKQIIVPSMVTDSVTALDSDTGEERWTFFADGPVRLAPVAWEGKIYFVSDDGCLYCLRADDGHLLWKFCGLPADRLPYKLLGNERLISRWPARGGPVLADLLVTHAGEAVDLRTGEHRTRTWKGINGELRGCGRALGSPCMITVRDAHLSCFDLDNGQHLYVRGIRGGCTNSLIPADGILNAPNYGRHCTCNYPVSTSLGLVTMPESTGWDVAKR
jgi:hypothetical protein